MAAPEIPLLREAAAHRPSVGARGHSHGGNLGDELVVQTVDAIRRRRRDVRIVGFSMVPEEAWAAVSPARDPRSANVVSSVGVRRGVLIVPYMAYTCPTSAPLPGVAPRPATAARRVHIATLAVDDATSRFDRIVAEGTPVEHAAAPERSAELARRVTGQFDDLFGPPERAAGTVVEA